MIAEVKAHLKAVLGTAGCGARVWDDPAYERLNAPYPFAAFHFGPEKPSLATGSARVKKPDGTWTVYKKFLDRSVPVIVHVVARTQEELEKTVDGLLTGITARIADENGMPIALLVSGVARNIPQSVFKSAVVAEVELRAEGSMCKKTEVGKIPSINIPNVNQQAIL